MRLLPVSTRRATVMLLLTACILALWMMSATCRAAFATRYSRIAEMIRGAEKAASAPMITTTTVASNTVNPRADLWVRVNTSAVSYRMGPKHLSALRRPEVLQTGCHLKLHSRFHLLKAFT